MSVASSPSRICRAAWTGTYDEDVAFPVLGLHPHSSPPPPSWSNAGQQGRRRPSLCDLPVSLLPTRCLGLSGGAKGEMQYGAFPDRAETPLLHSLTHTHGLGSSRTGQHQLHGGKFHANRFLSAISWRLTRFGILASATIAIVPTLALALPLQPHRSHRTPNKRSRRTGPSSRPQYRRWNGVYWLSWSTVRHHPRSQMQPAPHPSPPLPPPWLSIAASHRIAPHRRCRRRFTVHAPASS